MRPVVSRAVVQSCTACHDGGFLALVRTAKPKAVVSVRASRELREGEHVTVGGMGASWSLIAP